MHKFIQLLDSSGNVLKRLAIFIKKAFEARNEALNEVIQ